MNTKNLFDHQVSLRKVGAFALHSSLVLCVGFSSAVMALAAPQSPEKKEKPPQAPTLVSKPFPAVVEKQLPNGLRVIVIEDHRQPSITLRLAVPAGSSYDPKDKPGLAGFTADLLTQGTKTRKAQEIAQSIDGVGGSLRSFAGNDSANVSASVLSNSLALGMELMADVALNPVFAEDEIARKKTQAVGSFKQQMASQSYLADTAFDRVVLGDNPYAHPSDGTEATVSSFKQADMVTFHAEHFTPKGSILLVAGDVKPAQIFTSTEKYFGAWKTAEAPQIKPVTIPENKSLRLVVIDKPDSVQTEVRVGQAAIAYGDPDRKAAEVMNSLLGGGGFLSRLVQEIRVKRGLTYNARSSVQLSKFTGTFYASTFTKTESTVEVVKLILAELRKLRDEPITPEELTGRKNYLIGRFSLNNETADDLAGNILNASLLGDGKRDLDEYRQKIAAVTSADIQKFVKERLNPDHSTVVLVGKAADFEKDLSALGKVEKISIDEVDFLAADLRKAKPVAGVVSEAEKAAGRELLKKTIEALGGDAYLQQKSTVLKGSGSFTPPGFPQTLPVTSATMMTAEPNKSVLTMETGFGVIAFGSEGKGKQWIVSPQGVQERDNPEEGKFGPGLLRKASAGGDYTLQGLPDTEIDGRKMNVFAILDKDGRKTTFYADPQSHLILKVAYATSQAGVELLFADYDSVNGIKVAKKLTQKINGNPLIDLTFTEAKVNEPLYDKVFAKPNQ